MLQWIYSKIKFNSEYAFKLHRSFKLNKTLHVYINGVTTLKKVVGLRFYFRRNHNNLIF